MKKLATLLIALVTTSLVAQVPLGMRYNPQTNYIAEPSSPTLGFPNAGFRLGTSTPATFVGNNGAVTLTLPAAKDLTLTTSSTGKVIIPGILDLGTNNNPLNGVVFHNGFRLFHTSEAVGTEGNNFFFGHLTGNDTLTGSDGIGPGGVVEGSHNTAIGINIMTALTTGYWNVGVGESAGAALTSGTQNTYIGVGAGKDATTGSKNTGTGDGVLWLLTTGSNNTASGYHALQSVTTTGNNVAIGVESGYSSTGDNGVYIGMNAGRAAVGGGNVMLGYSAGAYETGSNAFYVDNQDRVNTAGDKAGALMYGTFNATPADQTLKVNASVGVGGDPISTVGVRIVKSSAVSAYGLYVDANGTGDNFGARLSASGGATNTALYVAAGLAQVADATESTNTTTGSIVTSGGVGIGKRLSMGAPINLKAYTVATLPAGTVGDTAYVTDATAPTYLGALVGGGAVVCPVFYNGAAWVSH